MQSCACNQILQLGTAQALACWLGLDHSLLLFSVSHTAAGDRDTAGGLHYDRGCLISCGVLQSRPCSDLEFCCKAEDLDLVDLSEDGVLSEEQRCAALGASCLLPFLEAELSRASFADMCTRCVLPCSLRCCSVCLLALSHSESLQPLAGL